MLKILFATSEVQPLIKTGGLADVSAGLPIALAKLGHQVRIVLPAYQQVMQAVTVKNTLSKFSVPGIVGEIEILECKLPGTEIKVLLVHYAAAFDRPGNPYIKPNGSPWHDNAERFYLFGRAIQTIATDNAKLNWLPDILHCNDWQTGLAPALLQSNTIRPATIFSIHNLAYQGLYPNSTFVSLGLPPNLWHSSALEFHGQFSFIKGGIVYSHRVNTVSPTYMEEIKTTEFGFGLEGLLNYRKRVCSGIINGIDEICWNPATDPLIENNYDAKNFSKKKRVNKLALQKKMGLKQDSEPMLLAFIGRLVEQKGIDIIIEYINKYFDASSLQLVILGSGESQFETALTLLQKRFADNLGLYIGYNEQLAHMIEAGADVFLMPSRFEPCGLNQMYSMRYGTLPLVNRVGGLSDTVSHASNDAITNIEVNIEVNTEVNTEVNAKVNAKVNTEATGFILEKLSAKNLANTISLAQAHFRKPRSWNKIIRSAMTKDFSWNSSAKEYVRLYEKALLQKHHTAR